MPIKGGYLIAAGGGAILLWSGLKGKSWSGALRDVVAGKDPRTALTAFPIKSSSAAFSGGSGSSGGSGVGQSASAKAAAVASDAMQYKGAGYVWGGAPGSGAGHWDCSSFANAVIGRDLGYAIPLYKPGAYHGQSHGPTTLTWLVWSGAQTISRSQAQAGDLAVWQTHMGIFIDNGQHMISALGTNLGTQVTTIANGSPALEVLMVRRLK